MILKTRAQKILTTLRHFYTRADDSFVQWKNPLELVIAIVLSAQCTDKRVNIVTKILFQKYITAQDYAHASLFALERIIHSTGFYKRKAKYVKGIGKIVEAKFGGNVPSTLEDLLTLPGVSYKSAHLVMAKAFGKPTGIAVDTHVQRIAQRLGLTKAKNSLKIEEDLEKVFAPKDYMDVNEFFILHGRAICVSRPHCSKCPLQNLCPSAKKFLSL